MSAPDIPDMELLLAHSAWIRSLARRLVGADSGADDLVQETWLAALARPARAVRSERNWLAGIVANLAREYRRGEMRRRLREQHSARASEDRTEPSAAETVEAAATGRELAGLVLELDEPFRTAVLLRYYEDLPPRRIAQRLGLPVRTVNSRLARGLERLRERWQLRERAAGRESWARSLLALAAPLSPVTASTLAGPTVSVASTIGVVLMNAKIWLGVALLGAGGLALLLGSPRGTEARDERVALAEPAAPAARPAPLASTRLEPFQREAESRAALETPARPAPPVAAEVTTTVTHLLRGRVLDPEARPRAGIEVGTSTAGGEVVTATSGANGVFELELPRGSVDLRATDPALVTVLSGRVNDHTAVEPLVVVAPRIELAGVVLDAAGAPLAPVRVHYELPRGFHARFEAVFDATEGSEWKTETDERGRFELAPVPSIAGALLVAELEGFEPARVEVPWNGDRELVLTLVRGAADGPVVVGRVVDAEHQPVPGAWVSLGGRSTATDSAGEFRLACGDSRESFELRALKSGHGLARSRAAEDSTGLPAWPAYVILELGPAPLAMTGRVVDGHGAARAGLRVWIADPTPFGILDDDMEASVEYYLGAEAGEDPAAAAYWSSRDTDAEGQFRFTGLLEREYSLRVMNPRTLEILTAGPFAVGTEPVEVVFADGPLGRIEGRVVAGDGRTLAGVKVTILGNTFGGVWSGAETVLSDAEGRFAFDGLGGEGLMLSVAGDDVMPNWSSVELPRGGKAEVELVVTVRCHFQLDLGLEAERADALRVLDGDGAMLNLYRIGPTGSFSAKEFPVVAGRSESLGVADSARTLLLLKGGAEVLRIPLALRPGTLNLLTP